jgi:hypothetical protein
MIRFFVGNGGLRWRFEVRAVPMPRNEPEATGSVYDSYLTEVGAWNGDDAAAALASGVGAGAGDGARPW